MSQGQKHPPRTSERSSRRRTTKRSSARRGRQRATGRDRAALVILLAAIAVLLGFVIALLPDAAGPVDAGLTAADRDAESARDPAEQTGAPEAREPAPPSPPTPRPEPAPAPAPRPESTPESPPPAPPSPPAPRLEPKPASDPAPPSPGPLSDPYVSEPIPDDPPSTAPETPTNGELWWLPVALVPPEHRGPLVLVLDDAGNSLDGFDEFLGFAGPMAIAVLPRLGYSVQAAALAAAAGKEIMLHQPMEAIRGGDPGPGAIGPAHRHEEIVSIIRENLATVPGAIGVNNHMGSLATADRDVMHAVLATLHRRELFFLDSRTTADTVGRSVAAEVGIPFAERAVFLDNWRTRESILSALRHALELSQRGSPVVMIGHVTVPLLAAILRETYPILIDHGYEFVPISRLVTPVVIVEGGSR